MLSVSGHATFQSLSALLVYAQHSIIKPGLKTWSEARLFLHYKLVQF